MTKQQRSKGPKHQLHGWVNLDKPYDMTSTQAVTEVKKLLSPAKIGHAGTLDPLATGVLPLALGEATKTVPYLMEAFKTYRFTVTFGEQTTTDDSEGEVIASSEVLPADDAIEAVLPGYIGEIDQLPPTFSAIKVGGKRAYDLARAGQEVALEPRPVFIESLRLVERLDARRVVLEAYCGKGTYVRSLARDIAVALGSCGHVSALRRESVGSFVGAAAISLDELAEYVVEGEPSSREEWLEPVARALDDIPAVRLDPTQARRLRHGQSCFVPPHAMDEGDDGEVYRAVSGSTLIGLVNRNGRHITPRRLFNHG